MIALVLGYFEQQNHISGMLPREEKKHIAGIAHLD